MDAVVPAASWFSRRWLACLAVLLIAGCSGPNGDTEGDGAAGQAEPNPVKTFVAEFTPTTLGMAQADGVYVKPTQHLAQDEYTCVLFDVTNLTLYSVSIASTWSDGQRLDAFTFFRDDLAGPYWPMEVTGTSPLSLDRRFEVAQNNHTDLFVGTGIPAGDADMASVGVTKDINMTVRIDYAGNQEPAFVVDMNCDDFIHSPI